MAGGISVSADQGVTVRLVEGLPRLASVLRIRARRGAERRPLNLAVREGA
jgi:hypothetical protein